VFGEKIDRLGDGIVRFYRYDSADHHIHCVHGGVSLEALRDSPSRPRRIPSHETLLQKAALFTFL
jgi:hypothetical protein